MNCLSEDVLRRYADRELSSLEVDEHLSSCERCRERLGELRNRTERVQELLGVLAPAGGDPDPARAYARLASAIASAEPEPPRRVSFLRRTPVWSAAAACALILVFTLSPARSWGQRFLSMLRVQKVAVVPVDLQTVTAQLRGSGHEKLLAQFISDNVVVTMKPGAPAIASSPQNASAMVGFPVTTLSALGTPQRISVTGEGAFQMTLDRSRIQALFDAAGRSDLSVPLSVDGSLVAVHIPKSVHMQYGNCSKTNHAPSANCVNFIQVPSPTVSVPPSLNIAALAEAGLQVAGMDAAQAQAFSQSVDWSSTLVIPVPENAGSYETVPVDGVNGTLIASLPRPHSPGGYALIWVKNGIIYSLAGGGSADTALNVAESLH
ncbi:MAG TPA: hypothetical protein VF283_23710 [Bryobacteraceae bacterium]